MPFESDIFICGEKGSNLRRRVEKRVDRWVYGSVGVSLMLLN